MYKFDKNHQFSLADFNQPMGLKMNILFALKRGKQNFKLIMEE